MKISEHKIFAGMKMLGATVVICAAMVMPARAADNGCSREDNDRISAELALCTTHAYNIGLVQNPESDTDKQLMRDVVALKTTVMTQQMYKQYEYLDATIRRFRTQLEKAILTTKLQAAGATDDNGGTSGSYRSGDRNVVLSGAENCLLKTSTTAGLQCLQNNIRIVLNAVAGGNIGDAKRQLDKDLGFAVSYGAISGAAGKYTTPQGGELTTCNKIATNRDAVNACAYDLNIQVMRKIEDDQNKQRATPAK